MRYPNGRILIFAKAPVPGYAKTRLAPVLGAQGAADLQAKLIHRTVDMAVGSRLAPTQIWACGHAGLEFFDAFRFALDGQVHIQCGHDLGARMGHALEQALGSADFAVLIGTDCPAMDSGYLERACAILDSGCNAVLGPAEDGGYVLIGLRRYDPRLFGEIAWGTSEVFRQTREHLHDLDWTYGELPTLWDIDLPDDLRRLVECDFHQESDR